MSDERAESLISRVGELARRNERLRAADNNMDDGGEEWSVGIDNRYVVADTDLLRALIAAQVARNERRQAICRAQMIDALQSENEARALGDMQ